MNKNYYDSFDCEVQVEEYWDDWYEYNYNLEELLEELEDQNKGPFGKWLSRWFLRPESQVRVLYGSLKF